MGGGFIILRIIGRLRESSDKGEMFKTPYLEINIVGIILIRINCLELTPDTRTNSIYHSIQVLLLLNNNSNNVVNVTPIVEKVLIHFCFGHKYCLTTF